MKQVTLWSLMLACGLGSAPVVMAAGNKTEASCPATENPGRGRKVVENQALGRALDKKPIGIGMARRLKDKISGDESEKPCQ